MRHDYTRLPLRQAILLVAVPMVLEMIMESLFAVIYAFALFLGVVGIAFVLLGETIVRAFTPDPEVVRFGSNALRIISAGFLFYACGMVVTQAFNGAGDTRTPTLINLGCYWLWEIPLAWLPAGPLGLVPTGVFISVLVGFSTMAMVSVVLFRRRTWKRAFL
ncbi:MAG TPA: MATE family efflux transporter [Polyangia bacterium]|nr:MATE family efflux transporter [Polyangia bacterium]